MYTKEDMEKRERFIEARRLHKENRAKIKLQQKIRRLLPIYIDWEKMARSCLEAILKNEKCVEVFVHKEAVFREGFPQGLVRKDGEHSVRKINAKRLIKWLQDEGLTTIPPEEVKSMAAKARQLEKLSGSVTDDWED